MFLFRDSLRLNSQRPARTWFCPQLESLEDRFTPTGPIGRVPAPPPPPPPPALTINVTYNLGRSVTLSGDLTGAANVAYVPINITGKAIGSTATDATGHYSITLIASGLGQVTATTGDGLASASAELTDEPPVITDFEAIEGQDRVWTFRGTVTYFRYFEELTVFFGGQPITLQNKSTTTDAAGYFELVVILNGEINDNGNAWARAESAFGLLSDYAFDYVHQTGV